MAKINELENIQNSLRKKYSPYNIDNKVLDDIFNTYSQDDLDKSSIEISMEYSKLIESHIISMLKEDKENILSIIEKNNTSLRVIFSKKYGALENLDLIYKRAIGLLETRYDFTKSLPKNIIDNMKYVYTGKSDKKYDMSFLSNYKNNLPIDELSKNLELPQDIVYKIINGSIEITEDQLEIILLIFDKYSYDELKDYIASNAKEEIPKPQQMINNSNINDDDIKYNISFIKNYINGKVLSKKQLMKILTVKKEEVDKILSGKRLLTNSEFKKLANYFGVETLDDLRKKLIKNSVTYSITFMKDYLDSNLEFKTEMESLLNVNTDKLDAYLSGKDTITNSQLNLLCDKFKVENYQQLRQLIIDKTPKKENDKNKDFTVITLGDEITTYGSDRDIQSIYLCGKLKGKDRNIINEAIKLLSEEEQHIIFLANGEDLLHPKREKDWNEEYSKIYYGNILHKIAKIYDNLSNQKPQIQSIGRPRISIYNKKKFIDIDNDIIYDVINSLSDEDKKLFYKINGEDLNHPKSSKDATSYDIKAYKLLEKRILDKCNRKVKENNSISISPDNNVEDIGNKEIEPNIGNKNIECPNDEIEIVFNLLPNHLEEDIRLILLQMNDVEKELFYIVNGTDLHRPKPSKNYNKEKHYKIYMDLISELDKRLYTYEQRKKLEHQEVKTKENIIEEDNKQVDINNLYTEQPTYKDIFKYLNDIEVVISILYFEYKLSIEKISEFLQKLNITSNDVKTTIIKVLELYKQEVNQYILKTMNKLGENIYLIPLDILLLQSSSSLFKSYEYSSIKEIIISLLTIRFEYNLSEIEELLNFDSEEISSIAVNALEEYKAAINENKYTKKYNLFSSENND